MEWGDYIEDNGTGLLDDIELLTTQMHTSIPNLKQFDSSKRYKIGWYIKEL